MQVPLMSFLSLGGKSHMELNQVNREVVPVQQCFSRLGTEAAMICATTNFVSFHALSEAYTAGSPSRLADCLTPQRQDLAVDNAPYIECDQHDFNCLAFFNFTILDTSTDCSGAWFPSHTKNSMSPHQWWLHKAKSHYYIYFQTHVLGKVMNPLISLRYWLNSISAVLQGQL